LEKNCWKIKISHSIFKGQENLFLRKKFTEYKKKTYEKIFNIIFSTQKNSKISQIKVVPFTNLEYDKFVALLAIIRNKTNFFHKLKVLYLQSNPSRKLFILSTKCPILFKYGKVFFLIEVHFQIFRRILFIQKYFLLISQEMNGFYLDPFAFLIQLRTFNKDSQKVKNIWIPLKHN